jgi:hypothetical protein
MILPSNEAHYSMKSPEAGRGAEQRLATLQVLYKRSRVIDTLIPVR